MQVAVYTALGVKATESRFKPLSIWIIFNAVRRYTSTYMKAEYRPNAGALVIAPVIRSLEWPKP